MYGRISGKAGGRMDARRERQLRSFAGIVAAGGVCGIVFVFAMGGTSPSAIVAGIAYGLLFSATLGGISVFVLEGSMRG
jgi:adenylate cyclase